MDDCAESEPGPWASNYEGWQSRSHNDLWPQSLAFDLQQYDGDSNSHNNTPLQDSQEYRRTTRSQAAALNCPEGAGSGANSQTATPNHSANSQEKTRDRPCLTRARQRQSLVPPSDSQDSEKSQSVHTATETAIKSPAKEKEQISCDEESSSDLPVRLKTSGTQTMCDLDDSSNESDQELNDDQIDSDYNYNAKSKAKKVKRGVKKKHTNRAHRKTPATAVVDIPHLVPINAVETKSGVGLVVTYKYVDGKTKEGHRRGPFKNSDLYKVSNYTKVDDFKSKQGRRESSNSPNRRGDIVKKNTDSDSEYSSTDSIEETHPSPKRASPKRGSPKWGSPKRGSPKRGSPKRGSPKRGSPKRGSPKRSNHHRAYSISPHEYNKKSSFFTQIKNFAWRQISPKRDKKRKDRSPHRGRYDRKYTLSPCTAANNSRKSRKSHSPYWTPDDIKSPTPLESDCPRGTFSSYSTSRKSKSPQARHRSSGHQSQTPPPYKAKRKESMSPETRYKVANLSSVSQRHRSQSLHIKSRSRNHQSKSPRPRSKSPKPKSRSPSPKSKSLRKKSESPSRRAKSPRARSASPHVKPKLAHQKSESLHEQPKSAHQRCKSHTSWKSDHEHGHFETHTDQSAPYSKSGSHRHRDKRESSPMGSASQERRRRTDSSPEESSHARSLPKSKDPARKILSRSASYENSQFHSHSPPRLIHPHNSYGVSPAQIFDEHESRRRDNNSPRGRDKRSRQRGSPPKKESPHRQSPTSRKRGAKEVSPNLKSPRNSPPSRRRKASSADSRGEDTCKIDRLKLPENYDKQEWHRHAKRQRTPSPQPGTHGGSRRNPEQRDYDRSRSHQHAAHYPLDEEELCRQRGRQRGHRNHHHRHHNRQMEGDVEEKEKGKLCHVM